MDALLALKDIAFGRLRVDVADIEAAHLFKKHDTCEACVARLLSHPAVKRVRAGLSVAKRPMEVATS